MAAQSNRTITLTLNAQTNGADSVRDLAAEIDKLGKKGGDAAPEFQALSKELNELATRKDTVQTFEELSAAVVASKIALTEAKVAAAAEQATLTTLKAALDAAKASEEAYAVGVREASAAKVATKQANLEAKAALDKYVASIGGAKRVTDEGRAKYNELTQAVRDTKAQYTEANAALSKLTPRYEVLTKATTESAAAVREQEKDFNKVNATVDKTREEYTQLTTTLGATTAQMGKLGLDTNDLVGANNKLAQTMAKLQTEANQLKTALAQPGAAALTAAQKIDQAFAGMGVSAVRDLKAEIGNLRNAMLKLAQDPSITNQELAKAMAAGKAKVAELEAELKKASTAAKGLGNDFGGITRQFSIGALAFNAVTAAISAITTAGQKIPQVAAEFQSLDRTLRILTGSSAQAKKEMEYIVGVANRTGIGVKSMADSYIKLTAATKDTALAGAQTRRIFEAVSGAMGSLGASSDEARDAIMAVSQMVSKGTVSMEEMRQQLGERLPQSFQATARELNITTAELTDLISSGKMAADDMLPALARGLEKFYKTGEQNDTLIGKWNQFTTALKLAGNEVGESGLIDGLLKVLRIGSAIGVVVGGGFLALGKSIGLLAAGIKTGDITGAFAAMAEEFRKVEKVAEAVEGRTSKLTTGISDAAEAAKKAGKDFFTYSDGIQYNTKAILEGDSALVNFLVKSEAATRSAEGFATAARKTAEATRASGEAMITATNALGIETDKRAVATLVADQNTAALGRLWEAEKKVLAVMEQEALKRAEAIRDGTNASDTHKKQLVDMEAEIVKRKATVDGLELQTQATRLNAEALRANSEMMLDNSNRTGELKAISESYVVVIAEVRKQVAAGAITQKEAAEVEALAARAKAIYNDALKDQIEKLNALNAQKTAQFGLDTSGLNLAIAHQKSLQQTARLRGDEYGVTVASNNIKRLEIQLMEITAKVKAAEAQTIIEVTKVKREELRQSGELTAAKEAELRVTELGAQAKIKESEIITETVKQLKEVADATEMYGEAAVTAAGKTATFADSLNKVGDDADSAAEKINRLKEVQNNLGDGWGGNRGGGVTGEQFFNAAIDKREVNPEVAALAKEKIGAEIEKRVKQGAFGKGAGNSRMEETLAIEASLEAARKEIAAKKTTDTQANTTTSETPKATSTTHTVNINLGGRVTAVNTATISDANALTSVLRQLESDFARA